MSRITFDRIGRTHNPPPLLVRSQDPDGIADEVYAYARPLLASRDVDVTVDLENGSVLILAGFHVAGTGRLEP